MLPLTAVVNRFSIPQQYLQTLIDGCERDLVQHRYKTFEELKEYCYSVASIVGLISIEIFGYKYDETKEYAVNLGYALQLTNILRDIKADSDNGRIYLPQEDLERFHYSEEELQRNIYNENFVELMRFEARRAREYYHKARAALRPDESITMFAAQIMDAIYYRLLEKIEIADYNVYRGKISVSTAHKFLIALRLWMKTHLLLKKS
jgi:phytoene synthase